MERAICLLQYCIRSFRRAKREKGLGVKQNKPLRLVNFSSPSCFRFMDLDTRVSFSSAEPLMGGGFCLLVGYLLWAIRLTTEGINLWGGSTWRGYVGSFLSSGFIPEVWRVYSLCLFSSVSWMCSFFFLIWNLFFLTWFSRFVSFVISSFSCWIHPVKFSILFISVSVWSYWVCHLLSFPSCWSSPH